MAALPEPNPYALRPQPTPHAEPEHTHRWRRTHEHLFDQRCIECNVSKSIADLQRMREQQKRIRLLENGIRKILDTPPRTNGARTGGFGEIHRICEQLLPISEMADDDR